MITLKPLFGYLAEKEINMKRFSKMTGIAYKTVISMRTKNTFNQRHLSRICMVLHVGIEDIMRYEED